MCDYSLESFARRDAKAGDQLRTEKLSGFGSVGLVAPDAPKTAVCLRPGTTLIVSGIPALLQKAWNVGAVVVATFEQRDALGRYRDGVRFDAEDHRFVLFQEFPIGVELSVEMIPGELQEEPEVMVQDQVAIPDKAKQELIFA
jgi:hypothetical protein